MMYQKHFFYALLLHIILLAVLMTSFEFHSKMPVIENANKPTQIIDAIMTDLPNKKVSINPTPPPLASSKPAESQLKPAEPIKPLVKIKPIVIPDKIQKKHVDDLRQKQLLADLKKQTEQNKKQQHKKLQAEFAKEMRAIQEKSLQQQMLKEQQRLASLRTQQMNGIVDKYKAMILQAISQNWLVPPSVNKKLTAELLIRLAPGGTVLDVQLMKSSGDEALDRSARSAVFKASPLPVPPEADAFEAFRQFVLKVKPENILAKDNWMS